MTIPNHAIADELAEIRARIRQLKTRENRLRQQVLDNPSLRCGVGFEAVIKPQNRRVFLRDRLPAHIARNPEYWETRTSYVVTVEKRKPTQARPTRPGDPALLISEPEFDVIERFA